MADRAAVALSQVTSARADETLLKLLHAAAKTGLHPIVQITNFKNISDADFLCIGPALVLVSRIITSPLALQFWHAYLFGRREEVVDMKGICRYAVHREYPDQLPDEESERVLAAIIELSGHVVLEFAGTPGCYGRCIPTGAVGDSGRASRIQLSQDYLEIARPSASSLKLQVRNYLRLASTIAHEIAHAVSLALLGPGTRCFSKI